MGRRIDKLVPVRIRAAAAMPAAVLTVHQLRYQLAFGGRMNEKLASQGHQYLGVLAPVAAMLLAIGAGLFLADAAQAWRGSHREEPALDRRGSLPKIWLLAALSLLLIYSGQELCEGLFAPGHPGGLTGIFGHGGLWAVPLSIVLGGLVALVLRVADAAIRWVASRGRRDRAPRARWRNPLRPRGFIAVPRGPLASAAPGRAPPAPLLPVTA
ncbi:MAG: hypothetical protein ACTHNP_02295 [Solirubrobacterales bacterium]